MHTAPHTAHKRSTVYHAPTTVAVLNVTSHGRTYVVHSWSDAEVVASTLELPVSIHEVGHVAINH